MPTKKCVCNVRCDLGYIEAADLKNHIRFLRFLHDSFSHNIGYLANIIRYKKCHMYLKSNSLKLHSQPIYCRSKVDFHQFLPEKSF